MSNILSQTAAGGGSAPKPKPKAPSGDGRGYARTRQTGSASGRPTEDEKQQVIRMQSIMMALANAMDVNKEALAGKFDVKPEDMARISGVIQDTGGSVSKALDGIWGNKTVRALGEIAKLAKAAGTAAVNPGKNYKQVNPENVIDLAKGNVDAIAELMRQVGLGGAVPGDAGARPEFYDVVPKVLTGQNVRDKSSDGFAVRPSYLDNIWKFYDFVYTMRADLSSLASKEDFMLQKLAEQINDASIYKLAQVPMSSRERRQRPATVTGPDAPRGRGGGPGPMATQQGGAGRAWGNSMRTMRPAGEPAAETAPAEEEAKVESPKVTGGVTFEMFDKVISWFAQRSNDMYRFTQQAYSSGETKMNDEGEVVPVVTMEEVASAKAYDDAVSKIAAQWRAQRAKLLGDRDPSTTLVERGQLRQRKLDRGDFDDEGGRGYGRSRDGRGRDSEGRLSGGRDGFTITDDDGRKWTLRGPLDTSIDLSRLRRNIPSSRYWSWLQQNADGLEFNIDHIRTSGSPDRLARRRLNEEIGKGKFAEGLTKSLDEIIDDLYQGWRRAVNSVMDDAPEPLRRQIAREKSRQANLNEDWGNVLARRNQEARRYDAKVYDTPF